MHQFVSVEMNYPIDSNLLFKGIISREVSLADLPHRFQYVEAITPGHEVKRNIHATILQSQG